jgi:lipopolysaccharide transport system ATP-binding protein
MADRPAIIIDGISKAYRIGLKAKAHQTFREALTGAAMAPLRRLRHLGGEAGDGEDTFWALKDVSFEVQPGEVVGIIGRNGSGKSTLLKILSRITEPTSGEVRLHGRVASLLEVGTGFHPELTGRENIYLNGAILGMKRVEIARKFDEIVAFAEVDKFLDTPVKHYSSGMYVRLAFAVAAHLEPEILIVDEVLAVGDAEFQKKCLGKMKEVSSGEGRTVLFVSHNMAAVSHLCTRALLLQQGRHAGIGRADEMVGRYLGDGVAMSRTPLAERGDREGSGALRFTSLRVVTSGSEDADIVHSGARVEFDLSFVAKERVVRPRFFLGVNDATGSQLLHMNTELTGRHIGEVSGCGSIACVVQDLPLPPGSYRVNVAAMSADGVMLDRVEAAQLLKVEAGDFYGTGSILGAGWGRLLVKHSWTEVSSHRRVADVGSTAN